MKKKCNCTVFVSLGRVTLVARRFITKNPEMGPALMHRLVGLQSHQAVFEKFPET